MVLVNGSEPLAIDIAREAEVIFSPGGTTLIKEGEHDNDMYFVLRGRLQVRIKEREFALLGPGAHVGEFALIDPGVTRSATVRALEDTVTAKLTESAFVEIAERHRDLWRRLSQVLGSHLREGNRFLRRPNPRPRVLICTSQIGWPFAQAIKAHATDPDHQVAAWLTEIFCADEEESQEDIEAVFERADFGIIVVAPGDLEPARGLGPVAGRDALFLHCGLCLGSLGRSRTLIIEPREADGKTLASFLGHPPLTYRLDPPEAIRSDLEGICEGLLMRVRELGSR